MTKTKIKGKEKFTMKRGLRILIGLIVEASESAKDVIYVQPLTLQTKTLYALTRYFEQLSLQQNCTIVTKTKEFSFYSMFSIPSNCLNDISNAYIKQNTQP